MQLPQHRSSARLNGRNALMLGVADAVMGDGIPRDAVDGKNTGKAVERLVGKV